MLQVPLNDILFPDQGVDAHGSAAVWTFEGIDVYSKISWINPKGASPRIARRRDVLPCPCSPLRVAQPAIETTLPRMGSPYSGPLDRSSSADRPSGSLRMRFIARTRSRL